jgi:hypothetical protein
VQNDCLFAHWGQFVNNDISLSNNNIPKVVTSRCVSNKLLNIGKVLLVKLNILIHCLIYFVLRR